MAMQEKIAVRSGLSLLCKDNDTKAIFNIIAIDLAMFELFPVSVRLLVNYLNK